MFLLINLELELFNNYKAYENCGIYFQGKLLLRVFSIGLLINGELRKKVESSLEMIILTEEAQ
jgi:hypothetical protein